jgi:hypothetical protein
MAITNFISTVWSENLLKQLEKKYIGVLNCNREFEGDIKEQGSVVKICGVGEVSVSDYVKNSDMTEPEELTDSVSILRINQAKYFNFQIDDVDRAQSNPKLMDYAMKNAAAALSNAADTYVFSLYTDAVNELTDNAITASKIVDHIIDTKTMMMKAGTVDVDDIVVEVTPDIAALMLKAKIDLGTDNADALENGALGKIAGCKIFVSNNVVIDEENFHKCLMRTKRAVAFAEQISEVEAYRPEKRFADAVKGLHLFGAKIVYPNEFVVLNFKIEE